MAALVQVIWKIQVKKSIFKKEKDFADLPTLFFRDVTGNKNIFPSAPVSGKTRMIFTICGHVEQDKMCGFSNIVTIKKIPELQFMRKKH